jgi:hypothetical protein
MDLGRNLAEETEEISIDENEDSCNYLIEPPVEISNRMFRFPPYQCFYHYYDDESYPSFISTNSECNPIMMIFDAIGGDDLIIQLDFNDKGFKVIELPHTTHTGCRVTPSFFVGGSPLHGDELPPVDENFQHEKYLASLAWSLFVRFYIDWFEIYKIKKPTLTEAKMTFTFAMNIIRNEVQEGEIDKTVVVELGNLLDAMNWRNSNPKEWTQNQIIQCWKIFLHIFTMQLSRVIRVEIDGFDIENYEGGWVTISLIDEQNRIKKIPTKVTKEEIKKTNQRTRENVQKFFTLKRMFFEVNMTNQ